MSVHIAAKKGEIAETVLLPGDPLRAKYIAEKFLENPVQYNNVRGMLGFTGTYKGKKVSVQGTGMGIPSISIYGTELITEFGCKNLIRIGSAGSYQKDVKIRDIVIALAASTDSNINNLRFPGGANFAPTASYELLAKVAEGAKSKGIDFKAGNIMSSDTFYGDDKDAWKHWADFGILCVEMEAAGLYTLGAKYGVNTLAILTISDSLVTGEATTSEEREKTFNDMIEMALSAI
ncbi:MAG: purine-nucleoside phosphorylase [Sebaldella sp.]|nr:purine-nucleoside phosphorylase [Sebaldella sp.]